MSIRTFSVRRLFGRICLGLLLSMTAITLICCHQTNYILFPQNHQL